MAIKPNEGAQTRDHERSIAIPALLHIFFVYLGATGSELEYDYS